MNQINCSFNDFFEFSYFDNFFKMISLFTEGYINKIINTVPDLDLIEYHSKAKAIDSNRFSSRLSKECFEKSLKIKFNYGENKEKTVFFGSFYYTCCFGERSFYFSNKNIPFKKLNENILNMQEWTTIDQLKNILIERANTISDVFISDSYFEQFQNLQIPYIEA